MSLSDHKISAYGTSISALEDKPKLSAAELKAIFDSRTDKEVKQAINGLIEALMATEAAKELGATDPETGEPGTVQGVMSALHEAVQERMKAADAYTREETEEEINWQIQEKMTEIGAGDMMRAVYDPQEKKRDVFAEIENARGEAVGEAVEAVYPVGAIYLSTVETSPATLFGFGTWERIQDTFLLAAGSSYAAGATGGEAEHTLTIEEMPLHSHRYQTTYGTAAAESTTNGKFQAGATNNAYIYDQSGSIYRTGGDAAHNNMPPYLAVYVWKRTA